MRKIILFFLLAFLWSDLKLYCEETVPEVRNIPKKSYFIAFAGSLISPVIGHAYIGGKNTIRGLCYTGGEIFNFLASIPPINWGPDAKPGDNKFDEAGLYWIIAIHFISAIDAVTSVDDINKGITRKSYFISTAGSAVFPVIGHSYLGDENFRRGALYSMGELAAWHYDSHESVMGIRILSVADAIYSTKKINDNTPSVILIPGTKSIRILFTKSF